jgi:integrase
MKFDTIQDIKESARIRSTVTEETLNTYIRESLRVLKEAYHIEDYDYSHFRKIKPFAVWLKSQSVRRRGNFANSIKQVLKFIGMDNKIVDKYETIKKMIIDSTYDERQIALSEKTERQKKQWVKWTSIRDKHKSNIKNIGILSSEKEQKDAMISAWFSNNSFILRPSEIRTMKIKDDGNSNYIDLVNNKIIIRNHKNKKRKGIRTITPIPADIKKFTTLYHESNPGFEHMIPTNQHNAYGQEPFKMRVYDLLGANPQIIRSVFISDYVSGLTMRERSEISKRMGHNIVNQLMMYDKTINKEN